MILGFALRANPVLVVAVAGDVTGLTAGLPLLRLLEVLGGAFLKNRYLTLLLLPQPSPRSSRGRESAAGP